MTRTCVQTWARELDLEPRIFKTTQSLRDSERPVSLETEHTPQEYLATGSACTETLSTPGICCRARRISSSPSS